MWRERIVVAKTIQFRSSHVCDKCEFAFGPLPKLGSLYILICVQYVCVYVMNFHAHSRFFVCSNELGAANVDDGVFGFGYASRTLENTAANG